MWQYKAEISNFENIQKTYKREKNYKIDNYYKIFSEEIRLQIKALTKINDWQLSYTDLLHARVEFDGKMRDFFRSELTFQYEKPITVDLLRDINTNTKVTIIVPTRRGDVKIYALLSEIKKNSYIAEV